VAFQHISSLRLPNSNSSSDIRSGETPDKAIRKNDAGEYVLKPERKR